MSKAAKMRHCFNCGEELGVFAAVDYDELDTCGKRECEREARLAARDEFEEKRDWDCGGDWR